MPTLAFPYKNRLLVVLLPNYTSFQALMGLVPIQTCGA
jgi:hypothetical protein